MSTRLWATSLRRRALATLAVLGVVVSISVAAPAMGAPESGSAPSSGLARALSGSSFNAGYIIDDANFYQRSAMSQAQIQAFLESKVDCANSNCLANLYAKTEKRSNDRNICLGYTPDSDALERASTIIYKVQQSCGISARVLLVTLQKEQGLITHSAPTTGRLNAAMGYRCPDTAPCSNQAAGFFRQIYGAAWQFRRYSYPDLWGNYHIGTYSIAYSTTSSCGRKTVTIRNNATAALYNYTPYTPNAGALSNLRGTAPCGSYGNRNFWVFYNDWFGSPLAGAGEAAINNAYTAYGGATSALGAKVSTGVCGLKSLSCSKTYAHGVITWTAADGAVVVAGAIGDYYLAKGGPHGTFGYPMKNAVAVDTADGDGFNQPFKNGFISTSPAGTFSITASYRAKHGALGGVAGVMGWPTAEKTCALPNKACVQTFQRGSVLSASSAAAAYAVADPAILTFWTAAGAGAGTLGVPTGDAIATAGGSNGAGVTQMFAGGLVAAGPSGTFTVIGPLRSAHAARGGVDGALGWPTEDRTCGLAGGTCSQPFQGGTLYASSTLSGAVTVPGIVTYYASKGGAAGSFGVPLKDAVVAGGANGSGYNQPFTNGFISSSAAGTFSLEGKIRKVHGAAGGVAGAHGWPLADQVCGLAKSGCSQRFQHSTIYATATVGGGILSQPIVDYYASKNGPASVLGYPIKDTVRVTSANGNGDNQAFEGGLVSSSAAGTFSLVGGVRTAHGTLGGVKGKLGWPTGDQTCGLPNNGCSQEFQHGTITVDSKGTRVVYR